MEDMKSHEKAQREAIDDEEQEEDTDILIIPIGFVIPKFIAADRVLYSQWFLPWHFAMQPIGRALQSLEISKLRNHCERHGRQSNDFSDLVDAGRRSVPE